MGSRQEKIRYWQELDASTRLKVTIDLAVMELGLKPEEICGHNFRNFGGLLTHFRGMLRRNESYAVKAEEDFWKAWAAMEEARNEKSKGNNHTINKRKTTGFRNPTGHGKL